MGKGDKKTRRGKIINRSYGVRRPKNTKSNFVNAKTPVPAPAPVTVPVVEEKVKKPAKPRTPKKKAE